MILLYSNNLVAEYPYGIKEFSFSQAIYDPAATLLERLKILDQYEVDYIVVQKTSQEEIFRAEEGHFRKVFENHFFWQKNLDLYIFEYLR